MGRDSLGKGKAKRSLTTSLPTNTAHYMFYLNSPQKLITSRMLSWLERNIYLDLFCLPSLIEHVVTFYLGFIWNGIDRSQWTETSTMTLSCMREAL